MPARCSKGSGKSSNRRHAGKKRPSSSFRHVAKETLIEAIIEQNKNGRGSDNDIVRLRRNRNLFGIRFSRSRRLHERTKSSEITVARYSNAILIEWRGLPQSSFN
jgi:hypothetical protein